MSFEIKPEHIFVFLKARDGMKVFLCRVSEYVAEGYIWRKSESSSEMFWCHTFWTLNGENKDLFSIAPGGGRWADITGLWEDKNKGWHAEDGTVVFELGKKIIWPNKSETSDDMDKHFKQSIKSYVDEAISPLKEQIKEWGYLLDSVEGKIDGLHKELFELKYPRKRDNK